MQRIALIVFCLAVRPALGQFVAYSVKKAPEPLYSAALPVCAPDDLRKVALPNATIDSVTVDRDVCRVALTVTHPPATDRVKVWVALPMKKWSGRLLGEGGMGFAGGVEFFTLIPAASGFVTVATDGGHDAGVAGAFAMTADGRVDWQSLRNFSHLAVHEMTVIAKALTRAFYGKPARYAYFCGLSNGGRQAIQAAQRYPEDYDGVLSAAPAIQYGQVILTHLWPQVVMLDARHTVSPAKLKAVTAAVIEACDAEDGAVDGIIDDPIRCDWDPKALVGTAVGDSTFTEADADVIRKIWAGPRTRDGQFLWYGFPRGSDLTEFAAKPPTGGSDWIRYFLLQDPKWDWKKVTVEQYGLLFRQSDDQYASLFSAPPPDLSGLRDHGSKLIIVQGMADQMVPPEGPIEYYERVVQRMGGLERVQPFARLFLVPGIGHMMEGSVGLLDSLISWVEKGQAPDQITWTTKVPGKKSAERPIYSYPLKAVYQAGEKGDDKPTWESKEGPRFSMQEPKTGKVIYIGTVNKDAMKGAVKYGDLDGTRTAKREPAKPKATSNGAPATTIEKATFTYATKGGQALNIERVVDTSAKVTGKRPAILFLIGGGWENGKGTGGDSSLLGYFASLGYAIIPIDYRAGIKEAKEKKEFTRANGTEMYLRAIEWSVEDLFDATAYVVEHAEEWNIDKDRIVLMGGSAGATSSLVAEYNVANDTELARAHLPKGFRYAGVVSMAGAFWLKAGTPLEFKSRPAPIMFFHGAKDQLVTYDEVQGPFSGYGPTYYFRKFPGPDYPKWFVDFPEGDHVVAASPLIENRYEIAAFLQKLVTERQGISVHTVEHDKVPRNFFNAGKLFNKRSTTGAEGTSKK